MRANFCCLPPVEARVTFIADQPDPICVTVENASGEDVFLQIEREPGRDSEIRVFGRPGENISSTKIYPAEDGVNTIRVLHNGRVIAERTIIV